MSNKSSNNSSENEVENLTGEIRNDELSGSRQTKRADSAPVTQEDMKGLMKEVMLEMSRPPEVEKLPGITVP
ncbi:hypothetical protein MUP59_09955, partial [Candidatus Bathyarchaeota archaeon]|nr:hypothetical protein [Candidatus Bathyarchaeota archaeon]